MEPITSQEIIDILEARYIELQRQLDYAKRKQLDDTIGSIYLKAQIKELKTVLHLIDIGHGIKRVS